MLKETKITDKMYMYLLYIFILYVIYK